MNIELGLLSTAGYITTAKSAIGTLGAHTVTVLTSATAIAIFKVAAAALVILALSFALYKLILFVATDNTKSSKSQKSEAEQFADATKRYEKCKESIDFAEKVKKTTNDLSILNMLSSLLAAKMKILEQDVLHFQKIYKETVDLDGSDMEKLKQYSKMASDFEILDAHYKELLINTFSKIPPKAESASPKGLANTGGTCCYINSSLQPLLASKSFQNLIPKVLIQYKNELDMDFEGRKHIIASLNAFLEGWNAQESAWSLGKLIEKLRKAMFEAGLQEGGFDDLKYERDLYDAGSFYELILHVIEQKFELEHTRGFPLSNNTTQNVTEKTAQTALYLTSEGSIQEKITQYGATVQEHLKPEDAFKAENGEEVTEMIESMKITSNPPALLVLRVSDHQVNLDLDQYLDCSCLFKEKLKYPAHYELVGFSQNHHQFHWTSVVSSGQNWHYCDDGYTYQMNNLDNSDFKFPANYLLYQRMRD